MSDRASSAPDDGGSWVNRMSWIFGGLSVLLLIAIWSMGIDHNARTPSYRLMCGNNIKQLALAIQNYHDTFGVTPYGVRCRTLGEGEPVSWGPSWIYATLPYCEQKPLFDRMEAASRLNPEHDFQHSAVWAPAHGAKLTYLLCPSSKLPVMEYRSPSDGSSVQLVTSSYVGIAGAWGDIPDARGNEPLFRESRGMAVGPNGGVISGGGVLVANEVLSFADVTDGSAYQIVVGETSNYYGSPRNQQSRSDGGGLTGTWFLGTHTAARATAIPDGGSLPKPETGPIYNLTTLRYGMVRGLSPADPPSGLGNTGIDPDKGANNPLSSLHPDGVMVGYLDGHVEYLKNDITELILKRLATRDDGGKVDEQ